MIDRHHLEIIRAIEQQGTLTKAADTLYLTQSALSHSIKKLESQLGCPLWHKEGRNLQLSESGKRLLDLANRVLPQFEHAELEIQDIAEGQRGTLRMGMECYPCFQWLLKVVSPFLKQYPDVDLDIRKEFQFGGIGALQSYDIDILITPDPVNKNGLEFISVLEYEQVLVVSNEHPLASSAYLKVEDMADQTLLTYPIETSRLDIFTQFLIPQNATVKHHKTIEDTDIMFQMIEANRGVAALPAWLVEEYQQQLSVTMLPIGQKGIHKSIYLGLRSDEHRPEYLQQLIAIATAGESL